MGGSRGWSGILVGVLLLLLSASSVAMEVSVRWTPGQPPSVATLEPVDVDADGVLLRGELLDLGSASEVLVSLEWGPTPGLGEETPAVAQAAPGSFAHRLEGLDPDRTYYVRAKAVGDGVDRGDTLSFRTAPAPSAGLEGSLWLVLLLVVAGALVGLYLVLRRLRSRHAPPAPPTRPADEATSSPEELDALDVALERLRAVREGGVPDRERGEVTTTLLRAVAAAAGPDGSDAEGPRRIDPEEARRRQAIFQGRIQAMDERLGTDPEDADALFAKATYLALRKEYQGALGILNELTRLSPRYPGVWYLKAKVCQLLGDTKMAELCLSSASRFR